MADLILSGMTFSGGMTFTPVIAAAPPAQTYAIWSMGDGSSGQLGDSTFVSKSSPVQAGSLTNWSIVSASAGSVIAIDSTNRIWAWGSGATGGLGLGDATSRSSPTQIGSLTNWSKVAGGDQNVIAIKTDGTLWGWGNGRFGKLGLGNTTYYSSPKQIGSLTTWDSVYAGTWNSFAIKTDNTAWCWGYNYTGQLGLNDVTDRSSPTQLGSAGDWRSFSISNSVVHGIKTNGSMWSWGFNGAQGQLGLGDATARSSPTQIGSLTSWLQVACSRYGSTAIKTDGTLWAWGRNNNGQLGVEDTTDRNSPVQVGALTNWAKLPKGSGSGFSAAIKTDGTLWTWGYNAFGNLGLNNTTSFSSPVQVGGLTTWYDVSRGNGFIVALKT